MFILEKYLNNVMNSFMLDFNEGLEYLKLKTIHKSFLWTKAILYFSGVI